MERRRFIVKAGGVLAAAGAAAVVDAPNVIAQPKVQWRMSTTWTAALDVLQGSAQQLAKQVDEMSGGRFRIEVFPGGQIMPQFACFDAALTGHDIEAFMAAPYYWAEKEPAVQWFATVPFGMNAEGMAAWYRHGDGLKLWEEIYAAFNLVPRPGPSTGPQMAGWFRRKITTIGDYKGLRMRIARARRQGGRQGGRHGRPDAGERDLRRPRAGCDRRLGVDRAARRHEARPPHHRAVLLLPGLARTGDHDRVRLQQEGIRGAPGRSPADRSTRPRGRPRWTGSRSTRRRTPIALEKLKTEFKGKVELLQLPAPLLRELKKLAAEVVKEESEKSPMATKVYASYTKFQAQHAGWSHVSEGAYHQFVAM